MSTVWLERAGKRMRRGAAHGCKQQGQVRARGASGAEVRRSKGGNVGSERVCLGEKWGGAQCGFERGRPASIRTAAALAAPAARRLQFGFGR